MILLFTNSLPLVLTLKYQDSQFRQTRLCRGLHKFSVCWSAKKKKGAFPVMRRLFWALRSRYKGSCTARGARWLGVAKTLSRCPRSPSVGTRLIEIFGIRISPTAIFFSSFTLNITTTRGTSVVLYIPFQIMSPCRHVFKHGQCQWLFLALWFSKHSGWL